MIHNKSGSRRAPRRCSRWLGAARLRVFRVRALPVVAVLASLACATALHAQAEGGSAGTAGTESASEAAATAVTGAATPSRFKDPEDGRFDVSGFLDTAYGFVPLLVPITEPAVGYGAVAAAVFIDGEPPEPGEEFARPTISAVGAVRTENDTRGWFGANLGTWWHGRLRTIAALADVDVNLEFFGLGDRPSGDGLGYSVKGQGGVLGGNYRVGKTQLWVGLRYISVNTTVALDAPLIDLPNVSPGDYDLDLGALTPSLTLDRRDNFFTPTRGFYVDLSIPMFRDSFGSDRDFETANLTAMYFRPLASSLYLSMRGTAKDSSDGTPFYLRPYVSLRGVQALQFQGEQAAELEAELRWQLRPRYSVVGFAGAGEARSSIGAGDRSESVTAGGAGFRYLIARRYGMQIGLDVAGGPDDTVFYVVFGSAWLRP